MINITTKNILQNYCVFVNVEFIIKSKERSEILMNEVTTITDNSKYDLDIRKTFNSVDGDTLLDMDLPATKFVIKDLLPQGLAIIGGSPKVGKSWLMLDWCVRIAKGEKIWNFSTMQGTTLYVSLEDTASRLQERLLSVTDEAPNVFFTTFSFQIGEGLEEQVKNFIAEHPDTVLIVIDTFQMIRNTGCEISYASDYNEVEVIKKLAEELKITILLVHHLRKQGDSDPFNMLSGTNGLAGGVDTMFVLDKSKRCSTNATLYCSGRDIEDREIELSFDKDSCTWNYVSDSSDNPEMLLPDDIHLLIEFMKQKKSFTGSNTDFANEFISFCGKEISAKSLKRRMNRYRRELEENGVEFQSNRSNGKRVLTISYTGKSDDSDVKDDKNTTPENVVNIVPVVPECAC